MNISLSDSVVEDIYIRMRQFAYLFGKNKIPKLLFSFDSYSENENGDVIHYGESFTLHFADLSEETTPGTLSYEHDDGRKVLIFPSNSFARGMNFIDLVDGEIRLVSD